LIKNIQVDISKGIPEQVFCMAPPLVFSISSGLYGKIWLYVDSDYWFKGKYFL